MDEDFHTLTNETEAKRIALEKMSDASHAYLKAISKRVEGDEKYKGLAIETFGMSMSAKSYTLREGSSYRTALQRMGDAHQNIGAAQSELISRFGSSYMDSIEKSQAQMKEYQTLQKKLNSRRQDYDAKLAKVQKAKKEKPEWEEEMQAAKVKYEEMRENVLTSMTTINESQASLWSFDDSLNSLRSYYEAQLAFARRMVEILEAIPESTFAPSPNGSRVSLHTGNGNSQRLRRQTSQDPEDDSGCDDQSSVHSIPSGRQHFDRTPSTSDLRRGNMSQHLNPDSSRSTSHLTPNAAQTRKNSGGASTRSNGLMAPPPVLNRGRPQKQVRALYTFDATCEEELSIQKGDIIRIVEEIDEGWWEGELVDANGVRQTGMFPSNYCEEIQSDSGSTHRQGSTHSNSSDPGRYMDEDEAAYYERETEPTVYYTEPEPEPEPEEETVSVPAARRAPPPPARQPSNVLTPNSGMTNGHANGAATAARATPPQSRAASSLSPMNKNSAIGTRMPPPPPPTRRAPPPEPMRQSAVFNGTTPVVSPPVVTGGGSGGPSPPPMAVPSTPSTSMKGYIPKDYFSNHTPGSVQAEKGPCRECQCTDFSANVFKRGSCNNCFHIH
ncbi:hypothetical protein BGX34_005476 [Mortierella sp. NVP85]|nr:hypothetical protein BGX34_005476 [Mortierella sp. NVP85]